MRDQFPITAECRYLMSHLRGPLPRVTLERVERHLADYARQGGGMLGVCREQATQTRRSAACLLGANEGWLAAIPNTTTGVGLVANGMQWRPGDEVLIPGDEYPANVYPWMQLARLGVTVREVPCDPEGRVSAQALITAIGPRTRMLAMSMVSFHTGYCRDVARIAEHCRKHGIRTLVDATVAVGWMDIAFEALQCDALVFEGRKFLCGLDGLGYLVFRPEFSRELHPTLPGACAISDDQDFLEHRLEFKLDSSRFESGVLGSLQAVALDCSTAFWLEHGMAKVEARVRALADHLRHRLSQAKLPWVGTGWAPHERGNLVLLPILGEGMEQALTARGLRVTVRPTGIRAALHAFNDESDGEKLIEALLDTRNQWTSLPSSTANARGNTIRST